MTFEEWWEANDPGEGYARAYRQGAHDYAKKAWKDAQPDITVMTLARRLASVECDVKDLKTRGHQGMYWRHKPEPMRCVDHEISGKDRESGTVCACPKCSPTR